MSANAKKKQEVDVLEDMLDSVEGGGSDISKDPQNMKVQKKFDEAFKDLDFDSDGLDFLAQDSSSSKPAPAAKVEEVASPSIEFDMSGESDISLESTAEHQTKSFTKSEPKDLGGIELDFTNDDLLQAGGAPSEFDEATKKTEIFSAKDLDFGEEINDLSEIDPTLATAVTEPAINELNMSESTSGDLLRSSGTNDDIEATINDIIRPEKFEGTAEIDVDSLMGSSDEEETQFNDNIFANTPDPTKDDLSFTSKNIHHVDENLDDLLINQAISTEVEEKTKSEISINKNPGKAGSEIPVSDRAPMMTTVANDDLLRSQSTIKQIREEREGLLLNIKELKAQMLEFEQDNLTLKSALDEVRIENNILRKRNITDLEDYKYRLSVSEEKRALLDEKVKFLERNKEKLEQKTRIDYNQIRQREKELESKLELMAMDSESQIQSREQKILELRRKIDSLEFNMENASIREQKSTDDKRKLEDKLNKIMKTLRHSIKNLEDDLDSTVHEIKRADKDK